MIALASFGNSTNGAQYYDGTLNAMAATTGQLKQDRESAVSVVLPNGLVLVVGGEHCAAKTYGNTAGFQCDAMQTAELYNESTKSFTLAGSGSGGLMTTTRSFPTANLITGSGTALDGKVLIVGGASGSSFISTATTPPAGSPPGQTALNSAEIYDPVADSFTATNSIPGCPAGTTCTTGLPSTCTAGMTTPITTASESSTTVTITTSSPTPGLISGDKVTVAGVSVAGYNGTFVVTGISGNTFTYTAASGLGAGSGGTAAADTFECGLVDHQAALIPNDGGKLLVAGGDNIQFLYAASAQAFIFDPTTATFTATGSMGSKRELFFLTALDPAVVSGPLAGQVLATGGINANSAVCTTAGDVVGTTQNTAEVYNPSTGTWSATTNNMATKRAGHGTVLWTTGNLSGKAMAFGGIDVEAGTMPSTCSTLPLLKQTTTTSVDLYDPGTGAEGTFSATTAMNQSRGGMGAGFIGVGSNSGDFIVMGGECANGHLTSWVIGASNSSACSSTAPTDYSELFDPGAATWTVGPAPASGVIPTNGPASANLP